MLVSFTLLSLLAHPQVGGELERIRSIEGLLALSISYPKTCSAGDRDRDGFPDFAYAHIGWDVGYKRDAGLLALISGDTGALLGSSTGNSPNQRLGSGLADAGDVDADGLTDLIVGTNKSGWQGIDNFVRVHSAADGSVLFEFHRRGGFSTLGLVVGGAGDVDGDDHADFFFTDVHEANNAGAVTLISGRTGNPLRHYQGGQVGQGVPDERIGSAAAFIGDADGDGFSDLVVSNPVYPGGQDPPGRIWLLSGATGQVRWYRDGESPRDYLGGTLARAGDVDRDGAADVLVQSDAGGPGSDAAVLVLSGRDGSELRRYVAPVAGGYFGAYILSGRDLDADGVDEHILSDPQIALPGAPDRSGAVFLHSGADGRLIATLVGDEDVSQLQGSSMLGPYEAESAELLLIAEPGHQPSPPDYRGALETWAFRPFIGLNRHEISAAAGGAVAVELRFPAQYAGHRYALLFSRSGRGPSNWHGLELPLAQDDVFRASAAGNYPAGMDHPVGILDAQARGLAHLQAGPQDLAAFVGLTFHLAAVVFDPISSLPIRTSVGAAFTVRP